MQYLKEYESSDSEKENSTDNDGRNSTTNCSGHSNTAMSARAIRHVCRITFTQAELDIKYRSSRYDTHSRKLLDVLPVRHEHQS